MNAQDWNKAAAAVGVVAFALAIASISTASSVELSVNDGVDGFQFYGTQWLGTWRSKFDGTVSAWGFSEKDGTKSKLDCGDMYWSSNKCKNQCIVKQTFSIVGIILCVFAGMLGMVQNTGVKLIGVLTALVSSVSFLIVWVIWTVEFRAEVSDMNDSSAMCSYATRMEGMWTESKLQWGFAFYVVAWLLTSAQAACIFMSRG